MQTSSSTEDNKIIIKWRVSEDMSDKIDYVDISYRIEDETKEVFSIAKNVFHGINPGGCSVSAPFQGCFVWEGDSIPDPWTSFSIRVDVFDQNGQGDGANSNDFNTRYDNNKDYYIFGSTKLGTHHIAVSDIFQTYNYPNYASGNLIVMPDGTIFINDNFRGVLRIDSNIGISNIAIHADNSLSNSDPNTSDLGSNWKVNGFINKIKIHEGYLYFLWSDNYTRWSNNLNYFTGRAGN